ncbi:mitochondrial carrier [Meredithblackwellia eburnea MCA 4105]
MASGRQGKGTVNKEQLNEFLYVHRNTIAAATGSLVSTVAGFPLDSVKSRLQVKRYSSVLDCVRKTYHAEGVQGFFRGVTIPLITITAVRTASFSIYNGVKEGLVDRDLLKEDKAWSVASLGFLGGAASGILLSVGTSAFEYTKISMQLDYLISMKKGIPFVPKGTVEAFMDVYRRGGIRSLYTGFWLHATRDTIGTGLYFSFVDSGRFLLDSSDSQAIVPKFVSTFLCGSAGGVASWALIYPIDLVKAKYQRDALAQFPREAPWKIFKRLSSGGITKLYRGLGVSAVRSVLNHGLLWGVLEGVRGEITKRAGPPESQARLIDAAS